MGSISSRLLMFLRVSRTSGSRSLVTASADRFTRFLRWLRARVSRATLPCDHDLRGVFLFRGFRRRWRFKGATARWSTGCFAVTADFILAVRKRPHEERRVRPMFAVYPITTRDVPKYQVSISIHDEGVLLSVGRYCPKIECRRNNLLDKKNF